MSKLLLTTQVMENYAYKEDGSLGVGSSAYWKAKGSNDYIVENVDESDMIEVLQDVRDSIEINNDAVHEYVINYKVVPDDYLTEFEQEQLNWYGYVLYPVTVIMHNAESK